MHKAQTVKSQKAFRVSPKYVGLWVALVDNKPKASDKRLDRLMGKVKRLHLKKEPSVMLIPRKNEGPYIL